MYYDDKVIAEIAARIADRIVPAIREANSDKVYPRLMTKKQAARFLGRTESSISHLIHRGQLPVVRHGRSVRLDREALHQWITDDSH